MWLAVCDVCVVGASSIIRCSKFASPTSQIFIDSNYSSPVLVENCTLATCFVAFSIMAPVALVFHSLTITGGAIDIHAASGYFGGFTVNVASIHATGVVTLFDIVEEPTTHSITGVRIFLSDVWATGVGSSFASFRSANVSNSSIVLLNSSINILSPSSAGYGVALAASSQNYLYLLDIGVYVENTVVRSEGNIAVSVGFASDNSYAFISLVVSRVVMRATNCSFTSKSSFSAAAAMGLATHHDTSFITITDLRIIADRVQLDAFAVYASAASGGIAQGANGMQFDGRNIAVDVSRSVLSASTQYVASSAGVCLYAYMISATASIANLSINVRDSTGSAQSTLAASCGGTLLMCYICYAQLNLTHVEVDVFHTNLTSMGRQMGATACGISARGSKGVSVRVVGGVFYSANSTIVCTGDIAAAALGVAVSGTGGSADTLTANLTHAAAGSNVVAKAARDTTPVGLAALGISIDVGAAGPQNVKNITIAACNTVVACLDSSLCSSMGIQSSAFLDVVALQWIALKSTVQSLSGVCLNYPPDRGLSEISNTRLRCPLYGWKGEVARGTCVGGEISNETTTLGNIETSEFFAGLIYKPTSRNNTKEIEAVCGALAPTKQHGHGSAVLVETPTETNSATLTSEESSSASDELTGSMSTRSKTHSNSPSGSSSPSATPPQRVAPGNPSSGPVAVLEQVLSRAAATAIVSSGSAAGAGAGVIGSPVSAPAASRIGLVASAAECSYDG